MTLKIYNSGVEQRKPGYTVLAGASIIEGQPLQISPSDNTGATIDLANGVTSAIGFALETNIAPVSPSVDYDNYNRGGKMSLVCGMGVEIGIANSDGRGSPYDTDQTYKVGQKLYVSAAKLVTNQDNGDAIGVVTKVPVSATDELKFKSLI